MKVKHLISVVVTVIALITFVSMKPFEVVDTGHRGVEITFGEVQEKSLPEGLYFYNPLTTDIFEIDTRIQRFDGDEWAYTKDVQQAKITYTINLNLQKDAAHTVYRDVGMNWQQKLVPQVVSGVMKTVIGKWDAVDLIGNRDKATMAIQEAVTSALGRANVTATKFEITNIEYSKEFENAIEAKVTAIQRATESQNKTVQIEEEAKQKVITAEAEAQSMRIRANALTQNKALVEYEAVQKWDGKMPTMMLGGGALPFINIK